MCREPCAAAACVQKLVRSSVNVDTHRWEDSTASSSCHTQATGQFIPRCCVLWEHVRSPAHAQRLWPDADSLHMQRSARRPDSRQQKACLRLSKGMASPARLRLRTCRAPALPSKEGCRRSAPSSRPALGLLDAARLPSSRLSESSVPSRCGHSCQLQGKAHRPLRPLHSIPVCVMVENAGDKWSWTVNHRL